MATAPRNRTLTIGAEEENTLKSSLVTLIQKADVDKISNKTIHQDMEGAAIMLPEKFADLIFMDPPYNIAKTFSSTEFKEMNEDAYEHLLNTWISSVLHTMKDNASIYVCSDWRTQGAVSRVLEKHFTLQNRITWEREKGRGAKRNWKNAHEDIWFATKSKKDYTFNVDAVKLKRKVLAPYKREDGSAKDWNEEQQGAFRLTHPSNMWTDLTVPFWSMPENTSHPTQKPEKLLAKIILASSNEGDHVFDPFAGSGTTAVVAKKLGRVYTAIERELEYAMLCEKRLALADKNKMIQGYDDGVFYERNYKQ